MEKDAEKLLRIQFQMEMLVYTQDATYSSSLEESKEEEQEENNHKKGFKGDFLGLMYARDNQATMEELMLHIKSYYKVCVDHSIIQNVFLCFRGGKHQNFVSYALDCKSTPG